MASTQAQSPISPSEPAYIQRNDIPSPSGTTVRTNGLHFLRSSWQNISRASKFMLVTSVFFIVSQIIVSIAILVIYQNDTCDKPLETYLIIYTVRAGLLLPLLVYQYLTRPSFLQRQQQQQQEQRQRQIQNRYQLRLATSSRPTEGSSPSSLSPSTSAPNHPTAVTPGISSPPNTPRINDNDSTVKEWTQRLKSMLDLFGILWFIVGNYLVFTSDNCPYLASGFYFTIMAFVILGYLVILIPVILCASVIFCLPCVLVILRLLNITDVPGMTAGASQEEILKIPTFKYQAPQENESGTTTATTITTQQIYTQKKSRSSSSSWSRRLMSRFSRKNKSSVETKSYPSITISCSDDAMCSICLSEYETGDLICKLWCEHHFHKDCVHEWLGLNNLCPLCKQNFRGKEYNEDGDSSNGPGVNGSIV
ncbi:hypothetical protein BCR42DRAFT_440066 [Absidia repens]|uniref:RING-type domain-containing protein n=1 Tax=Absidia repens TaxID=90262 RepID=A0A1X2I9H3_9FUNG|nr:hypothetical protein BCR42DRAFT_440066 [Absidia repens]